MKIISKSWVYCEDQVSWYTENTQYYEKLLLLVVVTMAYADA